MVTPDNMLQAFLSQGLFNIGDDDTRLEYFRGAAEAVAEALSKEQSRVIPAVLTALDPEVPVDDPVIKETETHLQAKWKTYRNAYPDTPRQFIRATIFEALRLVAGNDQQLEGAIWLTGASVLPFQILGREELVVRQLLARMGDRHENAARAIWDTSGLDSTVPEIPAPKIAPVKVDNAVLLDRLGAAVGPQNAKNQPYTAPANPQWPNSGQPWSNQFPAIAAEGITKAIESAISTGAKNTTAALQELTKKIHQALGPLTAGSGLMTAVARRTNLLWWKEALYSPTGRCSYRELPPVAATILMARELAAAAGPLTPRSVEYFLREAVIEVIGSSQSADLMTIGNVVEKAIGREQPPEVLKSLGTATRACVVGTALGRMSFLGLLQRAANGSVPGKEDIASALGVRSEAKLTLVDAAIWVFRDSQATELVSHVPEGAAL